MSDWWNDSPNTPQNQNPFAPQPPVEPQPQPPVEPQPQPPVEPQPQPPVEPQPQPPVEPQPQPPVPPTTYGGDGWTQPKAPDEPQMPVYSPMQPSYPSWMPPQNELPPMEEPPTPKKKKSPKKRGNGIVVVAVALLCVICLCCLALLAYFFLEPVISKKISENSVVSAPSDQDNNAVIDIQEDSGSGETNDESGVASDGGLLTKDIVKSNLDSTVMINLYSNEIVQYGNFSFGSSEEESLAATASGIVLTEDGYIVTNQHVVINERTGEEFNRIEVAMYSGAKYNAVVVGSDEDTDLAVIKIDATGLKPAVFSTSDVQLGDRVVTIGNSGGLEWSVSEGILSGKNRDVYDKTGYDIQCLQIDAAINPGNSGGPLLNNQGRVIGINSAKIVYDGIENLGFSIPYSEAKTIIEDLTQYGHVTGRVGLGITGYDVKQEGYEGFIIYSIEKGSSLEGTDVQTYDIITAIDGQTVVSRAELRSVLAKHKPGDKVELTLKRITDQRTGETKEVKVTITLKEITN